MKLILKIVFVFLFATTIVIPIIPTYLWMEFDSPIPFIVWFVLIIILNVVDIINYNPEQHELYESGF